MVRRRLCAKTFSSYVPHDSTYPPARDARLILYEYPFNERIRTLLRLEDLFDRLEFFLAQSEPPSHHVALITMFEILDVAGRADLKSDLIQELERQRQTLNGFRNNPGVDGEALERILSQIELAASSLVNLPRMRDLDAWIGPMRPLRDCIRIVLKLLRESGQTTRIVAAQGSFQQMLGGKSYQMLQVRLDENLGAIPEISANRYMIWVRFTTQDGGDMRPRPFDSDVPFDLVLCNL
jgi:cell division protein ZapD